MLYCMRPYVTAAKASLVVGIEQEQERLSVASEQRGRAQLAEFAHA